MRPSALGPLLFPLLFVIGVPESVATDLVACVVAPLPNNPTYNGMATTVTKLKCEFTQQDYYPTLTDLYRQNWRLIEVMDGDLALAQGSQVASPLYFLERESLPAPAGATRKPQGNK